MFHSSKQSVRALAITLEAAHAAMQGEGLQLFPSPVVTRAISSPVSPGSDSAPIAVFVNGHPTFLTDSAQFYLEGGCRLFPRGVYYVMPSFRDEEPDSRHLPQFWHAEAEIEGDLQAGITLAERVIRSMCRRLLEEPSIAQYASEPARRLSGGSDVFQRISYSDAVDSLRGVSSALADPLSEHPTITPAGEVSILKANGGGPVWVTHWDSAVVPFYQASDDGIARNADLLMGIGETVGLGERHATVARLAAAAAKQGVSLTDYAWYIQLKEARPMVTTGFGIGIERFLCWLLDMSDVREFALYGTSRSLDM